MIILVTNSLAPYGFDVQHVLGLPKNSRYRFRYQSRWFEAGLDTQTLQGKRALVVLRDWDTGSFHPCRFVHITAARLMGDVCHIQFRLEEYVDKNSAGRISSAIQARLDELKVVNAGGKALACLVLEAKDIRADEGPVDDPLIADDTWIATLSQLKDVRRYKDFGFLRILELKSGEQTFDMTSVTDDDFAYQVLPGKTYSIEVAQYMPSGSGQSSEISTPFDVNLVAPAGFNIIRGKQRVVGKYDLLRFVFDVPDSYAGKATEISIQAPQQGDAEKYGIQAMALPLVVESDWVTWILRAVSVVIGFLLLMNSSPLSKAFPEIRVEIFQGLAFLFFSMGGGDKLLETIKDHLVS